MVTVKDSYSDQAAPELVAAMQEIARQRGCEFVAVVEDAFRFYIESKSQTRARPAVMDHYRASLEKNRHLAELLAK
jgi:hypothetical protein